MRYKDELYCKLDLVKQAVVDIEEYIDIIDEVQCFLEGLSDEEKVIERKLKQMWDEGETFR